MDAEEMDDEDAMEVINRRHSKRSVLSPDSDDEIIPPTEYSYGKRKANSPVSNNKNAKKYFNSLHDTSLPVRIQEKDMDSVYDFQGFPLNAQSDSGNVVLVKPIVDNNNLNPKLFFKNYIKLASDLDNSLLGKLGIMNVRKNLARDRYTDSGSIQRN